MRMRKSQTTAAVIKSAVPPNAASILSGFLAKMHLVFVTITLVTFLLGSGFCQLDCAFPTEADVREVISATLLSGETAPATDIILTRSTDPPFHVVCLGHSRQKNRYRAFSVLVEYTCEGNACTGGTEQFDAQCTTDNTWGARVQGASPELSRTTSPTATFSTELREDCFVCASLTLTTDIGLPDPDDDTHCVGKLNTELQGVRVV